MTQEKEIYASPDVDIVYFDNSDVISTSSGSGGGVIELPIIPIRPSKGSGVW